MEVTKEELALRFIKGLIVGTEYEGHVFLVGGAVRDSIMGNPIKDIDLCIDLPNGGIEFATWIMKKIDQYKEDVRPCVFPTYGTAMFAFAQFPDVQIECVQTRKEQYHDANSRNPETAFGTLEEDCYRRDLTINSLYKNISTDEIIDITGKGIDDIKNHIIRTPCDPDITFSDDPLRKLRVIRFSSRYGWDIEEETFKGILRNAHRIQIITQERITDELNKILLTKKPSVGLRLLEKTGLLQYVLPDFVEMVNLSQNSYHFGTAWEHTLMVVDNSKPILENRLAALFHDLGKIKTKTIDNNGNVHFYNHENVSALLCDSKLRAMKYPNDIIKRVRKAVNNHMRTKSFGDTCEKVKDKSIRKLQFALGDVFDLTMDLIDADNRAHKTEHCMPNQVRIIKERSDELVRNGMDCFKLSLPIDGNDIIEFKGIDKPGPIVKKYLDYLTKLWLNNPKIAKEECLKHIKNLKFD